MHFLSKLHSNSILTGSPDSYCLVCDNYLRSEDEAFTHTDKPIHKKNLGKAEKVEKFLEDRIVKVSTALKKGYFCPLCNILLSTIAKVNIHISDPYHIDKKRSQITRIGKTIIAFDEVAVTLEAWHGITGNTCVVCNLEFDDDDDGHSNDQTHMLKLIQNKCEFGDRFIYRKVDEESFFCLICGNIFAISEKLDHHESSGHRHLYSTGREMKKNLPPVTPSETKNIPKPLTPKPETGITEQNNTKHIDKQIVSDSVAKNVGDIKPAVKKTETIESKKVIEIGNNKKPEVKPVQNTNKVSSNYLKSKTVLEKVTKPDETSQKATGVLNKAPDSKKAGDKNIQTKPEKSVANTTKDENKQSDILDRVEEFQKKGVNIDFTWEKARCKKCYENIPFETGAIEKHIEQHQQTKIENSSVSKINTNKNDTTEKQAKNVENLINNEPNGVEKPNDTQLKNDKKSKKANKKQSNENRASKQEKGIEINGKATENTDTQPKNVANGQQQKKHGTCDQKLKDINSSEKQPTKEKNENPKKTANENNQTNQDSFHKLAEFARDHRMVLLPNEVFCPHCKVCTVSEYKAITEHASSTAHKEATKMDQSPLAKKVSIEYIESLIHMESTLVGGAEVIVNEKHLLRLNVFHCIIMDDDDDECYNCMVCDIRMKAGEMMEHMNDQEHKNKLSCTKVVTCLPDEFVREIKPNTYHCGFCNEVSYDWSEMVGHLSTLTHTYVNRQAKWMLERCQAILKDAKTVEVNNFTSINYA